MKASPSPIDVHVGSRVRLRRMIIGMSQESLGKKLRLTFQQIQKYEKGANRIGSSRLFAIASILGVPVQFFFADMPEEVAATVPDGAAKGDHSADLMQFVGSAEGLQLNTAFLQISNSDTRRKLIELIKHLAG